MDFLKKLVSSAPNPVPDVDKSTLETVAKVIHPYYPTHIEIPYFVAHDKGVVEILGTFAVGCAVILGTTYFLASYFAPRLRKADKFTILWFCLCGFIHTFFEGYFAYNHARMGGQNNTFAQWWKEYAYSDSRYLTSDPFVLCMETVTAAFWGPLSFLMIYLIAVSHPMRHPLQIIISSGQFYGDVLYYATSMFDHYHKGLTYCRPEAYYFWAYYFFLNFFWIVIPGLLVKSSMGSIANAFRALDSISHSVQGNGPKANGNVKK